MSRTRRRARMRRAKLTGSALGRRARLKLLMPAFTKRGRRNKLKLRARLNRFKRAQAAMRTLPPTAPRSVKQRIIGAYQQAEQNLQSSVGGHSDDAAQHQQGFAMMAQAVANSTRSLAGLATASYAASRGMEVIGRSLAQYNGAYAGTNAMLDVSRMGRSIQVAGATSDSYSKMIASLNRLEQATVPFQIAAMKVANWILEKVNDISTAALGIMQSWPFNLAAPAPKPDPASDVLAVAMRARATTNVYSSPPGNARNINPAGTPPGGRPPPTPPPPPAPPPTPWP